MREGTSIEEQALEVVVDEFGGRVVVTFYLVIDDLSLFVEFGLGEGGLEEHVGQQFHGSSHVCRQCGSVVGRFLFGRVGIEFASDVFDAIDELSGRAFVRAFEDRMLDEMGHTAFVLFFVACIGSNHHASVRNLGQSVPINDPNAVIEGINVCFFVF